ncbi:MAG: P1 family peptidase [Polyangiaceae bacterium]|nr:P1 family peptidase [Polyangiaceae bacterium]
MATKHKVTHKDVLRPRIRDLGLLIGRFPTGPYNAITDVPGVRVGHVTKVSGEGPLVPGKGPVRTGVTAVLPASGDVFLKRVFASGHVLNGAGEMMGLAQVDEWGLCETPILLCDTLAVGRVADATVAWMSKRHPGIGGDDDVVLPVVGECDDSYLNDAVGRHISENDVKTALETAKSGPVAEGNVGAGTGMQSFDFSGGIGTSSRIVRIAGVDCVLGSLVLSNFGSLENLKVGGVPVGEILESKFSHVPRRGPAGSIIVLLATDVPLVHRQLTRLCRRAALAIGRCGGYVAHNSGEFIFSWSTFNRVPRRRPHGRYRAEVVLDTALDPLHEAAVDVVEEAIMNALCAGVAVIGHSGHLAPPFPVDEVKRLLRKYHPFVKNRGTMADKKAPAS